MAGPLIGYGGSIKWANGVAAELGEWSLDISVDMQDVTSFGNLWKRYLVGLREWTGSCSGRFDGSDAAQKAMLTALLAGTSATVSFQVDETHSFSGTAYLSAGSVSAAVEGLVEVSYDVQGNGELTAPEYA